MTRKPQLPAPELPSTPASPTGRPATDARPKSVAEIQEKYKKYLKREGKFAFAIDATGSMAGVIAATRRNIDAIITRSKERSGASVQVRLYAYRDYDNMDTLLEKSPFTEDATVLRNWLANVVAKGGGDHEEAMEAALKDIHDDLDYSGVFVVGDARPRTSAELARIRPHSRTAEEWARALFAKATKVHALWVRSENADSEDYAAFQRVAQFGGGVCGQFDGSNTILDVAVMAILECLKGAGAVEDYARDYHLTSDAQNFKALLLTHKKT